MTAHRHEPQDITKYSDPKWCYRCHEWFPCAYNVLAEENDRLMHEIRSFYSSKHVVPCDLHTTYEQGCVPCICTKALKVDALAEAAESAAKTLDEVKCLNTARMLRDAITTAMEIK